MDSYPYGNIALEYEVGVCQGEVLGDGCLFDGRGQIRGKMGWIRWYLNALVGLECEYVLLQVDLVYSWYIFAAVGIRK